MRLKATKFRSAGLLACVAPVLVLCGCSTNGWIDAYGLDSSSAALIQQTCTDIMGLPLNLAVSYACEGSLAESLRHQIDARELVEIHESCERRGLAPQTSGLAQCVLAAQRASVGIQVEDSSSTLASSATPAANERKPVPKMSYFRMNPDQQYEREKMACAELGIDPIQYSFDACVNNLKQALYDIQNPLT